MYTICNMNTLNSDDVVSYMLYIAGSCWTWRKSNMRNFSRKSHRWPRALGVKYVQFFVFTWFIFISSFYIKYFELLLAISEMKLIKIELMVLMLIKVTSFNNIQYSLGWGKTFFGEFVFFLIYNAVLVLT